MDRTVIARAVEDFLDSDIRRYNGLMADYWIRLRLCLTSPYDAKFQKKRDSIAGQTQTRAALKSNICEFALSSQVDILLAMAYEANQTTKKGGWAHEQMDCYYRYKCFLINVLVLLFQERYSIVFESLTSNPKPVTLVVEKNKENEYVLDLRFFMGYTFGLDERGQLRKVSNPEIPIGLYIGLHIPINHLLEKVKLMLKPAL